MGLVVNGQGHSPRTHVPTQQTQYIVQLLSQCWDSVYAAGPTLTQQW